MDTSLKKDNYEHLAPVWSGSVSRDFTAESIVPDAMPDVASVIDADGVITLRSKETEAGAVTLAATVNVSVTYAPETGGGMQGVAVTVPVELRMDAPGADQDCQTVARLRVRSVDAKMVNSRKLSVRAEVECEATAYQKRDLEIASGLAEESAAIHILTKTAPMAAVADVREKTFVVTDEYALPAGCAGVDRILMQRVDVHQEDVKYVSGKVVFRGRVRAGLVFACRDGQVFAGRYETEFSQIMEVAVDAADVTASIAMMFTGVYFDLPERQDADGKIGVELHLAAQAVCRQNREITYISDLYSNRTVLLGRGEELCMASAAQPVSMRQTVTGSAELMGGTGEVLAVCAAVGGVTTEAETVKTTVNVRAVLQQENGGFATARCRLTAEFTTDIPAGTTLQNVAADVYCGVAAGALDVRVVLQMEAMAVTERTVTAIGAIQEDQEAWAAAPAAPSICLVRLEPGADMWAVAKKYHSTVEAIAAANGEEQSGLLLIPKAK